jgi:hypothetical protein
VISVIVSDTDLVTITMNGMTDEYQMFITGLNAREKAPVFEELIGILMQEEERRLTHKPQSSDLALMAKKKPFRGKPNAAQKSSATPQRKMPPPQGTSFNRNDSATKCFYCGRTGHIARYCMKKKFDEGRKRHKQHAGHFVDEEQSQNLRLFISDSALSLRMMKQIPGLWTQVHPST